MSADDREQGKVPEEPQLGTIQVPGWMVLVTFGLGWGFGGTLMVTELFGNRELPVLLLAGWLITLPLAPGNPFKVLGEIIGGVFKK